MSTSEQHEFRLYVAGDAPNSVQAAENLRAICQEHLPGTHTIEIVDLAQEPRRAQADAVLVAPTLIRLSPGPERRMVGNLADSRLVLQTLGLLEEAPPLE